MVESRTRFYRIWYKMKSRCDNKKDNTYNLYGAKGITYIKSWKYYKNFKKDMYPGYLCHSLEYWEKNTSIDRKNIKGNYNKDNCRWATSEIQNRNRSNNIIFTHEGETKCLKEWCIKLWLKYKTVWQRINGYNWSIEKALNLKIN